MTDQQPPVVPPGWQYEPATPLADEVAAAAAAAELEAELAAGPQGAETYIDADGAHDVAPRERPPGPQLVHSGTYALYRTPAGLFHLTYKRNMSANEDGDVFPVDGAPDFHCRDLPEHAAMMVAAVLDRDQELPPMLAAFLFGSNPLAAGRAGLLRQVASLAKEAGGLDQLIEFAQQNGAGDGAVG